jgi:chorismate-pyruvate lyase
VNSPFHFSECETAAAAIESLCAGLTEPAQPWRQCRDTTPDEMPGAYRELLVHHEHMTAALARYHGAPVTLRVLRHHHETDAYCREILLTTGAAGRVVEYGVVRINLNVVSPAVRNEIEDRRSPLGDILTRHDVLRRVEPLWYVRFDGDTPVAKRLGVGGRGPVFGRVAMIHYDHQPAIELLEVVNDSARPASAAGGGRNRE